MIEIIMNQPYTLYQYTVMTLRRLRGYRQQGWL